MMETLPGSEDERGVALARALLLVLDEATSAVDDATEARIIRAIDDLLGDRTRIVISHRQATLVGVERLLVLDDGRLVERSPMRAAP
jgi:ABC-type multidrug transport system fused ATPase/permease subunit